jgi:hypothetical protein
VTLLVKPEISNKVADATFTFAGLGRDQPVIDKRVLESNVLIKSGDTLAIGGLPQDEQTKGVTEGASPRRHPGARLPLQEKLNARVKAQPARVRHADDHQARLRHRPRAQVSGLTHSGDEYADPNGWRNNAKGAIRSIPTSHPLPGRRLSQAGRCRRRRKKSATRPPPQHARSKKNIVLAKKRRRSLPRGSALNFCGPSEPA